MKLLDIWCTDKMARLKIRKGIISSINTLWGFDTKKKVSEQEIKTGSVIYMLESFRIAESYKQYKTPSVRDMLNQKCHLLSHLNTIGILVMFTVNLKISNYFSLWIWAAYVPNRQFCHHLGYKQENLQRSTDCIHD